MNADELRHRMSELPEPVTDKQPPFWEYWRWSLWKHVVKGDDPRRFFDWPEIYHTMLWRHRPDAIDCETKEILDWDKHGFAFATRDPNFIYPADLQPGTYYSQALLHQAYHLMRFEQASGVPAARLRKITEYGGGFGAMAFVLHRLGFCGEYTIIDLPEFLLLQEYYLSNLGVTDVKYLTSPSVRKNAAIQDLLIACYSLSEVDFIERDKMLARILANNYLFLYSNKFATYDNTAYFQRFTERKTNMSWRQIEIDHLPPGNVYGFGWHDHH